MRLCEFSKESRPVLMYVCILWLSRFVSRNEGPAGGSLEQLKKRAGAELRVRGKRAGDSGRSRLLADPEFWKHGRWGQRKREGLLEVRKKEIRQIDHFRF